MPLLRSGEWVEFSADLLHPGCIHDLLAEIAERAIGEGLGGENHVEGAIAEVVSGVEDHEVHGLVSGVCESTVLLVVSDLERQPAYEPCGPRNLDLDIFEGLAVLRERGTVRACFPNREKDICAGLVEHLEQSVASDPSNPSGVSGRPSRMRILLRNDASEDLQELSTMGGAAPILPVQGTDLGLVDPSARTREYATLEFVVIERAWQPALVAAVDRAVRDQVDCLDEVVLPGRVRRDLAVQGADHHTPVSGRCSCVRSGSDGRQRLGRDDTVALASVHEDEHADCDTEKGYYDCNTCDHSKLLWL